MNLKGRTLGTARTALTRIGVKTRPGHRHCGILSAGPLAIPVALGRGGIRANKREGDGATPRGQFRLIRLWWRKDRLPRPATGLPVREIGPAVAWCEAPSDRRYNRPISVADDVAGDRLWRDDQIYDLVIELSHNARPRIAGRGSAVFIHVARPGLAPTDGCVALPAERLRRLLRHLGRRTHIDIT